MVDSTTVVVNRVVCKEDVAAGSKSAVLSRIADPRGPRWTPTSTCCSRPCSSRPTISCPNERRTLRSRVTDAEVVTLCVAQAIMGIPSDRRFLAAAAKRLAHLFPDLPQQSGYFKRRRKLADALEWLMGIFASQSPGFEDDLLLIDSTPVECARSRETVKRSGTNRLDDALGNACDYGYCASHSRYFWGMRLHIFCSPDGTPRALELCSPKTGEREIGLLLLDRCRLRGGETLIGDKGYAGREFAAAVKDRNVTLIRPVRRDETITRPAGVTTPALRPAREITPNARAHRHAPAPAAAPRADPPTRRIDLLDREGHPRARTPRRAHPHRPARTNHRPVLLPHCRDHPQPPTRTPQP